MTFTPKDNKILIMEFPDSLESAEVSRYFWQLYDFPSWRKCLPLLGSYDQTFL